MAFDWVFVILLWLVTIEMNKAVGTPFKPKQGDRSLHSPEGIPADLAVCGISSFLYKWGYFGRIMVKL